MSLKLNDYLWTIDIYFFVSMFLWMLNVKKGFGMNSITDDP